MKKDWKREEIVEIIKDFERTIHPEEFVIDSIKAWPWLRVRLFFFVVKELEINQLNVKVVKQKKAGGGAISRYTKSVTEVFRFLFVAKARSVLFAGNNEHRALLEGVSYNKFFDPFRSNGKVDDHSVLFEYSSSVKNTFQSSGIFSFSLLALFFDKLFGHKNNEAEQWKKIEQQFADHLSAQGVSTGSLPALFQDLRKSWIKLMTRVNLWNFILKRIKPKAIFTLCYYSDSMYALNIAASGKGIPTYEMQHGPINPYHLAYGGFDHLNTVRNSPVLPKAFLVWDKFAQQVLNQSFPEREVIVIGQPWLDFLAAKRVLNTTQKSVLYALQPISEIGNLFPDFLIKWIKESSGEYLWKIRLHPRQFNEKKWIETQLAELFPSIQFDIDKASTDPLPIVLSNSTIVITNFSGVITEAIFMDIPSIAIHNIASLYFAKEFQQQLTYLCQPDDFNLSWEAVLNKMKAYIKLSKTNRLNSNQIFNDLINDQGFLE